MDGQWHEGQEGQELKLDEVSESSASPEVAEVYGRIKDTLRVGVVNYVWRVFAAKPQFLKAAWEQLEHLVDWPIEANRFRWRRLIELVVVGRSSILGMRSVLGLRTVVDARPVPGLRVTT